MRGRFASNLCMRCSKSAHLLKSSFSPANITSTSSSREEEEESPSAYSLWWHPLSKEAPTLPLALLEALRKALSRRFHCCLLKSCDTTWR